MPPAFWIPWLVQVLALIGLVVAAVLAVLMAIVLAVLGIAALAVGAVLHVLGLDRRLLARLSRRRDARVAAFRFHFPEMKPEVDDLEAPIEARWTVVDERSPD